MKTDIKTRKDIQLVVNAFYIKLMKDPEIGHFFNDVVQLDLDLHLPIIIDFWEGILLDNPVYRGNPMVKHIELNRKSRIHSSHFERCLTVWEETIQSQFEGAICDKAIERDQGIADLMEHKLIEIYDSSFLFCNLMQMLPLKLK